VDTLYTLMPKPGTSAISLDIAEASAPESRRASVSKETSPLDSVIGTIGLLLIHSGLATYLFLKLSTIGSQDHGVGGGNHSD